MIREKIISDSDLKQISAIDWNSQATLLGLIKKIQQTLFANINLKTMNIWIYNISLTI